MMFAITDLYLFYQLGLCPLYQNTYINRCTEWALAKQIHRSSYSDVYRKYTGGYG
jgi:hypothetical protein